MDKDNRTLRREIFMHYEGIANEKRLTIKDVSDLTGISRGTLTGSIFLNDRPLYTNLFVKLCLGLDALPSELLGIKETKESEEESPEDILNRLGDNQLRAVLMHALSYTEGKV